MDVSLLSSLLMDLTQMQSPQPHNPFNGLECWSGGGKLAPHVEFNDFVRVLDIRKIVGSKNQYVFFVLIQKNSLAQIEDATSSLRILQVTLTVAGIRSSDDFLRVRRRFEMEANKFNNVTKAKNPGYKKRFEQIDLSRNAWKHFLPK